MIARGLVAAALAGVLMASGVEAQSTQALPQAVSSEDVKQEIREAIEVTKIYLLQKQEEADYRAIEAKIQELDRRIEALKPKLEQAATDVKPEVAGLGPHLQQRAQAARRKLEELRGVSPEGWEDVKPAVVASVQELEQAVDDAETRAGR